MPRVKKAKEGTRSDGVVPILGEVAILGGYLERVVEVYVVEMQSDGGVCGRMVEEVCIVELCVVEVCVMELCRVERCGSGGVVCGTGVPVQQASFLVPLVVVPS